MIETPIMVIRPGCQLPSLNNVVIFLFLRFYVFTFGIVVVVVVVVVVIVVPYCVLLLTRYK